MSTVMTVTGPVEAGELGRTLPHEHLYVNTMLEYRGSGLVNEEPLLTAELKLLKAAGGATLVELSLDEIGRDPAGLRRLSDITGINVVMGCGHYRDPYLDRAWFDRTSVDEIAAEIIRDIEQGVGDTGVRAGIIGEIGADQPYISAAEERSFRAAARAHHRTGLTITTHSASWPVGLEQLALLREEGVDPRRIIIGHCDSVLDSEYHFKLARAGCFVAFDCIGTCRPWDNETTLGMVLRMVDAGFAENVLLSHDVHLRGQHKMDGGCGYTFIYETFGPRLLEAGISEQQLEVFLVDNPRAALTGERAT